MELEWALDSVARSKGAGKMNLNITETEAAAIVRGLELARKHLVAEGERATLRQRYPNRPKHLCAQDTRRVDECRETVEAMERVIGVLSSAEPRRGDWLDATQKAIAEAR
jgi:hypothetical protein